MYKLRLDRIAAVILIILAPFILRFLKKSFSFGSFSDLPFGYSVASDPELKGLILLGMILIAMLLIVKILNRG